MYHSKLWVIILFYMHGNIALLFPPYILGKHKNPTQERSGHPVRWFLGDRAWLRSGI